MRSLPKGRLVTLCGVVTLTIGGAARGAEAEREVSGPVRLVDPTTRTLHLSNSQVNLHVDGDTQVTRGGEVASLADVNEGDEVRASYSGTGDDVNVSRLEITGASAGERAGSPGSRGQDRTSARSEIDPKLAAPSASPSGQSGRQTMPVQVKQR